MRRRQHILVIDDRTSAPDEGLLVVGADESGLPGELVEFGLLPSDDPGGPVDEPTAGRRRLKKKKKTKRKKKRRRRRRRMW